METHSFLLQSLIAWRPLGYALVFIGLMIEGDAILFAAAFLTRMGFFDFGDMTAIVLAGTLLGDTAWYELGARFRDSTWRIARWAERLTAPVDTHIRERPFRTIFISKFTYGLHHPILMRAGAIRLGYPRFIRVDFVATILWASIVGGLGYFSSYSFVLIRHYLRIGEVWLVIALVIFVLGWNLIGISSRRKL